MHLKFSLKFGFSFFLLLSHLKSFGVSGATQPKIRLGIVGVVGVVDVVLVFFYCQFYVFFLKVHLLKIRLQMSSSL